MRLHPRKRIAVLMTALAVALGCEDATVGPDPIPATLGTGLWYLNTVNDSVLGSTIAERFLGISVERTVVDSGSLSIGVDGTYEQRYWVRVFVSGALDRSETVIDIGTYTVGVTVATFVSTVRSRTFTVRPASISRLVSDEPMVFFADPPITVGEYRRTRP